MDIKDFIGFFALILLGILSQVIGGKGKKTSHPPKRQAPAAPVLRAKEPPRPARGIARKEVSSQRVIPKSPDALPGVTKKKQSKLSALYKNRSSLKAGILMKEILQRPYD